MIDYLKGFFKGLRQYQLTNYNLFIDKFFITFSKLLFFKSRILPIYQPNYLIFDKNFTFTLIIILEYSSNQKINEMSQKDFSLGGEPNLSMDHSSNSDVRNFTKNVCTTKFTKNQTETQFFKQFQLGKNDLLEKTNESEIDSEDNDSELSFQERLGFEHQKIMGNALKKYIQQNTAITKKNTNSQKILGKSLEQTRLIEQRTFQQIDRKYGSEELSQIKFTIKFIKRNHETSKIYYEVPRSVQDQYRLSCFLLFKETLSFYFKARKQLKSQFGALSRSLIESYARQNYLRVCQSIITNQKMEDLHYAKDDDCSRKKFEEFVLLWIESFLLCKEGFSGNSMHEIEKVSPGRSWMRENFQGEIHKRIKRW